MSSLPSSFPPPPSVPFAGTFTPKSDLIIRTTAQKLPKIRTRIKPGAKMSSPQGNKISSPLPPSSSKVIPNNIPEDDDLDEIVAIEKEIKMNTEPRIRKRHSSSSLMNGNGPGNVENNQNTSNSMIPIVESNDIIEPPNKKLMTSTTTVKTEESKDSSTNLDDQVVDYVKATKDTGATVSELCRQLVP